MQDKRGMQCPLGIKFLDFLFFFSKPFLKSFQLSRLV